MVLALIYAYFNDFFYVYGGGVLKVYVPPSSINSTVGTTGLKNVL